VENSPNLVTLLLSDTVIGARWNEYPGEQEITEREAKQGGSDFAKLLNFGANSTTLEFTATTPALYLG
jgi:hypothetical protein